MFHFEAQQLRVADGGAAIAKLSQGLNNTSGCYQPMGLMFDQSVGQISLFNQFLKSTKN